MRWFLRILLILTLMVLATGGYVAWRVTSYLDAPMGEAGTVKTVEIPKGASFKKVVQVLFEAEVVSDPVVFEGYARFQKATTGVKAGRYAVDLGQTPRDLLKKLTTGGLVPQIRITIPEGLNRWEVADLLVKRGLVKRDAFLKAVEAQQLEGRLFPDTYWIRTDASLEQVIQVLTDRFDAILKELIPDDQARDRLAPGSPDLARLLALASMVEKEARVASERARIARVFENRLAKGMKLQSDPTCMYGPRLYTKKANPGDCKDPSSQYSTYVIPGLPPGPIANPGRAALDAALHPEDTPEARRLLFFVARQDGTGAHVFSEDYKQHQQAVNRYLKGR